MTVDLEWLLKTPAAPEPDAPTFVTPPVPTVGGPGVGEISLGCGILVPFQRDRKGDFNNGCAEDVIRSSVAQILGVQSMSDATYGELEWRPEFGSLIHLLKHANTTEGTVDLARYYVIDALRVWEPRINVRDALVVFEENTAPGGRNGIQMIITVLYDIIGQRRSTAVLVPNVVQDVTLQAA